MCNNKEGDGMMGVFNKTGTPVAIMAAYKEDGGAIAFYDKNGEGIRTLP